MTRIGAGRPSEEPEMASEVNQLDAEPAALAEGIGLALSGGGYRAMVFHVGSIIRMNEVGLLSRLNRVSSVSGGSITAAALAMSWPELDFVNGTAKKLGVFIESIRAMAERTVDVGAVIGGVLFPGAISDRVADAYDSVLFKGATLKSLPAEGAGVPRFVMNATNVQSSALWRFSRDYMGDYRVGLFANPDVKLAVAVAASSAFPPILSPLTLPITGTLHTRGDDLCRKPFTDAAVLSDGGVYDNLGLETISKRYTTLLVSDAGQKIAPEEAPHHDWARHAVRILDTVDNQVRSLRKRHLIESFQQGQHTGTYWGIGTHFNDYKTTDPLECAKRDPTPLAEIPTRLEAMPTNVQNKLMNWGYSVCDAALRSHLSPSLQQKLDVAIDEPKNFPFPGGY
jgi:NTE family protein